MSWPSKRTLPEVEVRSPVRQLKKVDLPAPFGPIRPRMSPCSSVTEAASTARKLPNALVISRASRSIAGLRCAPGFGRLATTLPNPVGERKQPGRLETRDQHDDRAIDDKGQA